MSAIQQDKPKPVTDLLGLTKTQPGRLRSKSTLVLETRHAQMIFEGRKGNIEKGKAEIVGLKKFASLLKSIWQASSNDDPYADWWLIKIERALESATQELGKQITNFNKLLSVEQNLKHEVSHSIEPIELELRFSIPYAFQGAKLLMIHDELVRTLLTANHVGVSDNRIIRKALHESGRKVRGTFQNVTGFRFTGLTREEIKSGNAKALKAMTEMGAVPEHIMDKSLRPSFLPEGLIFANTDSGYFSTPSEITKKPLKQKKINLNNEQHKPKTL